VKSKVINAGASIGAVIVVARLHSLAPLLESPKWLAAMKGNMELQGKHGAPRKTWSALLATERRDNRVSSSIGKTKRSKPFKAA
jgi:hypothetical protein